MQPTKTPFAKLYFGKSDPLNEVRDSLTEFVTSYVDLNGAIAEIVSGKRTLVLGPKGTGKSALGVYLEKTSYPENPYFARIRTASSLPLAEIPQLRTGQPSGTQRTFLAWKFILLANYLHVALSDKSVKLKAVRDIRRVINLLADYGFVSTSPGKSLLQISNRTFTLSKADAGTLFKEEGGKTVNIYALVPYMERWATAIESPNRHLLLLDGLDSIFLNDKRFDESLSGLAQAAYEINIAFADSNASGSIVLLLRNDIFSRISLILPDAHKMRDVAYDLDWRVLSGSAGGSAPLLQLVNRKAAQVQGGQSAGLDVLSYFPPNISRGKQAKSQNAPRLQYILNLTRHTPRDILQLMENVRLVCATQTRAATLLSQEVIREGALQYSSKYFVDAIRGEFAGYEGGRDEAEGALQALKMIPESRFTRSDFRESLRTHSPGLEQKTDEFLRLFFFAGALGNLFSAGNERYMVFYHRRNDVDLNMQGTLVLHNALTYAWSRRFGLKD